MQPLLLRNSTEKVKTVKYTDLNLILLDARSAFDDRGHLMRRMFNIGVLTDRHWTLVDSFTETQLAPLSGVVVCPLHFVLIRAYVRVVC